MDAQDVIFTAKLIRTKDGETARAVAVRDGRIVAVGSLEDCQAESSGAVDNTFDGRVLVPGFVEAHSHVTEGLWSVIPYVGWFDRPMPDGSVALGIRTYEALVGRLKELSAAIPDPTQSLMVGGFDPIYFRGAPRLNREVLDQVSTLRPILVLHASLHLATVNSALLTKYGIDRMHPSSSVGRDATGDPDGELREPPAMSLAREEFRGFVGLMSDPATAVSFATAARYAGITTATDLAASYLGNPDLAAKLAALTADPSFPIRLVPAQQPKGFAGGDPVAALEKLREHTNDKLSFPIVKIVLDGSIQGWTAMVGSGGYFTGSDHGEFLYPPEQLADLMRPFHQAGVTIHCHCNGDLASEAFLDAVETLIAEHPWPDHRHTMQHGQLITPAQLVRSKELGVSLNFFVNHIWFWGDQHHDLTVGPERANRMNPCGSAQQMGIPFSFHSDAGVTPIGHLHTMWCAMNRVTVSGRVLGENQRLTGEQALHAATLGAARQLRMDDEIGSIEIGKRADFTVLDDDPLSVDPMAVREIRVWGTVLGGIKQPNRS